MEENLNTRVDKIQRMNDAAGSGNIRAYKDIIKEDPFILEKIDSVPFIETPLHKAAAQGQTDIAMEILSLTPSFFSKLDPEWLSPIHVALKHEKQELALRLLDAKRGQIPCERRERIVPIHWVAEEGNIDLLGMFLSASPESIQDVTPKSETVLHIALKNDKLGAFYYLVRRLRDVGSSKQEKKILNWKDNEGNTILHIAVRKNDIQLMEAMKELIKRGVDMNIKNSAGFTALESLDSGVDNQKVKKMLEDAGATSNHVNIAINSEEDHLRKKLSFEERLITSIVHLKRDTENDKGNAFLVIMVYIATVTYQASLTPPGGVWQDNNSSSATQVHHHAAILRNMTLMALLLTISSTTLTANAAFTKLFTMMLVLSTLACYCFL